MKLCKNLDVAFRSACLLVISWGLNLRLGKGIFKYSGMHVNNDDLCLDIRDMRDLFNPVNPRECSGDIITDLTGYP